MKKTITILLISSLFGSCYTAKKAQRQVTKAQVSYPLIVAESCGAWYPPKESSITETSIIKGQDVYIIDTVVVDCTDPANVGKSVAIEKTVQSYRTDTIIKTVTKTVENTATIKALIGRNDEQKTDIIILKQQRVNQRKTLSICYVIIGILSIFTIYKFIK